MLTSLLASAALVFSLQVQPAVDADEAGAQETTVSTAETEMNATEEAEEQADPNEVICRRTRITGSKFSKKLCGTRSQWEDMTARNRETAREMQRRGKGVDPSN